MAFDFPSGPSENQEYTPAGGPTYVFKSPRWLVKAGGTSVSDVPPPTPASGQLWWESDSGDLFIWYVDADGGQWVQANGPGLPTVSIGDAPPGSPLPGQLWWESDSGRLYAYFNDGSSSQWVQISGPLKTAGFVSWPAGVSLDWWGPIAPAGTLFCYGQSLAVATYADLFAVLQYAYGGSGANFNLPDCRGRTLAGKDNMGGTSAGRLLSSGQGGSVDGLTLGGTGGADRITLATGHLPAHVHTPTFSGSALYFNAGGGGYRLSFVSDGTSTALSTTPTGSDLAHSNAQPTIVCNKLITTGGI